MTAEEFLAEYERLGHAIQTGTAYEHELISPTSGTPKHLRTGLNCVMSDVGALAHLLIEKGVISDQEYYAAMIEGLQREVADHERRLTARIGRPIQLG
jgi:hypothetical protein